MGFCKRLPLLKLLSCDYPNNLLKNCYLIACQHILPSTRLLIHSLFDLGLSSEKTALIGKCYSTSQKTYTDLKNEGVYVCPSSLHFNSYETFDMQFQSNISNFLQKSIQQLRPPVEAKIIILDDGGELINQAWKFLQRRWNLLGVEQTSSGYYKLKQLKLNFPVVNVARSQLKLEVESPMIAEAQAVQIIKKISLLGSFKKGLLIGNGAIGKALFEKLSSQYDISRYDKIASRSDLNRSELCLKHYGFIIGTTGRIIVGQKEYSKLKKEVVLISSSSSDREFDAVNLRRQRKKMDDCHQDVWCDGVLLANCGFPINFYGSQEDSVHLDKIQLTMGMLFEGVCQGMLEKHSKNGLTNLNQDRQEKILSLFSYFNSRFCLPHSGATDKVHNTPLQAA